MWKVRRQSLCEIIDDKSNRVIAFGIEEAAAQAICDKHNWELSDKKWAKTE